MTGYVDPRVTEVERKVGMSTKEREEPLIRVSLGGTAVEVVDEQLHEKASW